MPPVQRGRIAPRVAAEQDRLGAVLARQAEQDAQGGGLSDSVDVLDDDLFADLIQAA